MAVIQPYEDKVVAQGALNVQASPADFGAQVGAAVQNVGAGVERVAEAQIQNEITDDVTKVHVKGAQFRQQWNAELEKRINSADPSDPDFAKKFLNDYTESANQLGDSFSTRQGQQTWARISADLGAAFSQQAIAMQGNLAAQNAKNQYNVLSDNLGSIAAQDHTQWRSLIQQGVAAIDDPDGQYARVPKTTRDAFKQALEEQIKFDAAKGFVRRYPNAALGAIPPELRNASQAAVANQPRPGLPPNLNAPVVKPYDQKRIDDLTKQVTQPSPYDDLFKQAGQLYNLDWRELKMRSAAESSINPNATNGVSHGIMQMTDETAKSLGVDLRDPKAAIFGAAKLIAQYRTQAGGDMVKVDKMYYGGPSGSGWGANTNQYAANLAATRQAIGLGSAVPPEAFQPSPAAQTGASQDWKKPSTGIDFIDSLPADKFFQVITEAEHYQRAYDSQSERERMEQRRQKEERQQAVMDSFTQRIINPTAENGGRTNEIEIVSHPDLDAAQKQHMITYMKSWEEHKMDAQRTKSDPAVFNDLYKRINAPDGDKTKLYDPQPIYDALRDRKVSPPDYERLMGSLRSLKDGSGGGFQKDMNTAMGHAWRALQSNTVVQAMEMASPGIAADVMYRFQQDAEKQADELRRQNKDPRVLLDPAGRDYILAPGKLARFMPGGNAVTGQAAAKAAAQGAASLPSYKDYDTLPKGASYTDPQGNIRVKGN